MQKFYTIILLKFTIIHFLSFQTIQAEEFNPITVSDINFLVPGLTTQSLSTDQDGNPIGGSKDFYYAFEKGDKIIIDFSMINRKGTNNLTVTSEPQGNMIYQKIGFAELQAEQITVSSRTVLKFAFNSNHIFDRNGHFVIKRIPSDETKVNFNTEVFFQEKIDTVYNETLEKYQVGADTVPHKIISKKIRVYSITNLNNISRTFVPVHLPKNTSFWIGWIDVEEQGKNAIKEMLKGGQQLAKVLQNPTLAVASGILQQMPALNNPTATINYFFTDLENKELFMREAEYGSYTQIKHGNNIANDFIIVNNNNIRLSEDPNGIYLCFKNSNNWHGRNVDIEITAFEVKPKFEYGKTIKEIRKQKIPMMAAN